MRLLLAASIAGCLLLGACSNGASDNASPATTRVSTSTSSVEASPSEPGTGEEATCSSAVASDKGLPGEPLSVGITLSGEAYHTNTFGMPFSFRTHSMAYPFFPDVETGCSLFMHSGESGALAFLLPEQVYEPGTTRLVDAPKDLLGWLQKNPYLTVKNQSSHPVGGIEGTRLQITVKKGGQGVPADCPDPCLALIPGSADDAYFASGVDRSLWTMLTVGGRSLLITIDGAPQGYGTFVEHSDQLLGTLHFKD